MDKQSRYDTKYLEMAEVWAGLSHAKRKKVGALLVKDSAIIADGYNGTPSGFENECEDSEGKTKWYVLHAEANAILKVSKSTQNCEGSTLYLTLSPCKNCAKLIAQAGIKKVIYIEEYKDNESLEFLRKFGVECVHYEITRNINTSLWNFH